MSIQVQIVHKTRYTFDRLVSLSPHIIRLRPAPHCRTPILSYSLKVTPEKQFLNWQQDAFGNYQARLVFPEKTRELYVEVSLIADMTAINPFDFFVEPEAESFPFDYSAQLKQDLAPYFKVEKHGSKMLSWLKSLPRKHEKSTHYLVDINQKIQQLVGYTIRLEPGIQSCEETLTKKTGSCRDSAWLLVQTLRAMGLAARFVSGYLVQLKADQAALDGPSGTETDFNDLHAWCEVYIPGAGWVGLDPTSGLLAGEGHIPLAATPEPVGAAAITGATDVCEVEFSYSNEVFRYYETPRVTKPYSAEQWQKIDALGQSVDALLQHNDVRLTMGGEPTFVAIEHVDSPEWNTAALGKHKRERAESLFRQLHRRISPGGLLQYTQGKWYPGEQLPRWSLNCYTRVDGEPIWRDEKLLANPLVPGDADAERAECFIRTLARELGVPENGIRPAYEDNFYYLWQEDNLPQDISPEDNALKDPLERKRLRRTFEQGLDRITGFLLPLAWQSGWQSGKWHLRREHLFLVAGDSPMGLRLPLASLPDRTPPADLIPLDPFAPVSPLRKDIPPAPKEEVNWQEYGMRTALCAEVRDAQLYIFLPPFNDIEAFLNLVQAIENCASKLKLPVILEGYSPPHDTRLKRYSVTPDPGVIEVNVEPVDNWKTLVEQTTTLYEEAREARLCAEKFMLDGRHTGTGGGNHVTLGGQTPADSPFLRRPDLLGSFVRYWQNHPALSYLFSGLFIGPTSQAPRVDEARHDSLYELDIALNQLPDGNAQQPWLVDRLLRNLLVDLTGNTHRAEFCIDKLYSPDSATGRLGLLELRAFEMPPHAQMSLVQGLLLRALVARFWQQPYRGPLVRWGTQLHDKYMLPHFIERDMTEVIQDLNRWGFDFDPQWLLPFYEFRFPQYGLINASDVEMELRSAIEPWHVMGEENNGGGTSRYVDSSVERVQIKLTGMVSGRHRVLCNGCEVPLRPTGREAEFVGGVRFKAWQPASGLHPTIPVQAPLKFDLVDDWNGLTLGGCTYHVGHPAGRNYDSFPINSLEAETRRRARFWHNGHSSGGIPAHKDLSHNDMPYTLDLRLAYGSKPA